MHSFWPILQEVQLRLIKDNMSIVHKHAIKYVKVLHFFTGTPTLAKVISGSLTLISSLLFVCR